MFIRPVFLLVFSFLGLTGASPKVNAAKEVLKIVNNPKLYDAAIFPKEEGPIQVEVTLFVRNFEIDDINMEMKMDLTFRMSWRDHRLNYSEPGVKNVRFTDYKKFWIPDAFIKTAVKTVQSETIHPDAFISVDSRGHIMFSIRLQIDSKCPMDLSSFPHDRQECFLLIASYGLTADDLTFIYKHYMPIQLNNMIRTYSAVNFEVLSYTTDYCNSRTLTGNYSCLKFSINLRRNFATYLCEWYLPCICLVVIAFFSELLPVDALIPRLLLTVGPLLVLITTTISYSEKLATVTYTTAMDMFTDMSLTTIFMITLHVIIGHYFAKRKEHPKLETSDEESASKFQKIKSKLAEKGDFLTRIIILGLYVGFLILYSVTYSS